MTELRVYQVALELVGVLGDAIKNPEKITEAGNTLAAAVKLSDEEIAKRDEFNQLSASTRDEAVKLSEDLAKLADDRALYNLGVSKLNDDLAALEKRTSDLATERLDFEAEKKEIVDRETEVGKKEKDIKTREDAVTDKETVLNTREEALTAREAKVDQLLSTILSKAEEAKS